jgi:hypothetical protein
MNLFHEAADRDPAVTQSGRDYLAWAKRFVWRAEMGDKTLMPIQVQFARQALGMDPNDKK